MTGLPDRDLDAVAAEAWLRLRRGAADTRAAFNRMQVATLGPQGWPEVRTVVLREVSASERRVVFHTDRRSAKAAEIAADGRMALHLWDPKAQLQLRLWGQARLLTEDPAAEAAWERLHEGQRRNYRGVLPPGRPLDDPAEADAQPREAGGRGAFALVPVTVVRFEWLELRPSGHRRARLDWTQGRWQGRWIVP